MEESEFLVLKNNSVTVFPEGQPGLTNDGKERLDMSQDEPILYASYEELLEEIEPYGLPFLLAVAETTVPATKEDNNKFMHSYYEATGLNKLLFGKVRLSEDRNECCYFNDRLSMVPRDVLDPICKQYITTISYYLVKQHSQSGIYLGNDFDLFGKTPWGGFLTKLFKFHTSIRECLATVERDNLKSNVFYKKYEKLKTCLDENSNNNDLTDIRKCLKEVKSDDYAKQVDDKDIRSVCTYLYNVYCADHTIRLESAENAKCDIYNYLIRIGILYREKEKYKESEKYFKKVIEQNIHLSPRANAQIHMGLLYKRQGKNEEAEKHLKEAAEQNDDVRIKAKAQVYLGVLYREEKKYEESEEYFKKVIEQDNDSKMNVRSHRYLGVLYFDQKMYQESEQYLKLAIDQDIDLEQQKIATQNLGLLYQYYSKDDRKKMGKQNSLL